MFNHGEEVGLVIEGLVLLTICSGHIKPSYDVVLIHRPK